MKPSFQLPIYCLLFQSFTFADQEFKCSDCSRCCINHSSCGSKQECEEKFALTILVAISLVFAGLLLFVYFQTRGNNECCDIDCLRRTFNVKDIETQHHIGGIFGVEDEESKHHDIVTYPEPQESLPQSHTSHRFITLEVDSDKK
jgi:hypothetical protein